MPNELNKYKALPLYFYFNLKVLNILHVSHSSSLFSKLFGILRVGQNLQNLTKVERERKF